MAWFKLAWFRRRRAAHTEAGSAAPSPATASATPSQAISPAHGIVMYGTPWCGDCRRAKRVFAELAVAYDYVDIEDDPEAAALVMRLNGGMRSVPTILFPDGSVLVEPRRGELTDKLAALTA